MAIPASAMCNQFKRDLFSAVHNFNSGGNTFKFALIKASESGTYNANTIGAGTPGTSAASTTNLGTDEASGTGYTSGGFAMTNNAPVIDNTNGVAFVWFTTNPSWSAATFSANGGILYNSSTTGNLAVSVHSFGGTQTVTSGTFTVLLPSNNSTSSILRIG